MPKVVASTILDAPTHRAWALLRDFNGFERWHPLVGSSRIERGAADRVGCVRRFVLADGTEMREQLLALSDLEQTYTSCLLETPFPLFNFVSHMRLLPVTDGNRTFWQWEAQFTARAGEAAEMVRLVSQDIQAAGFAAIRPHLEQAA